MQNVEKVIIDLKNFNNSFFTCLTVWNDYLYSGSCNGNICKWNRKGEIVNQVHGYSGIVHDLVVWNNKLYSAATDDTIKIWNPDLTCDSDLQLSKNIPCTINALKVWNDRLCACGNDSRIRIWTKEGKLKSFDAQASSVLCIEVWRRYLCTASGGTLGTTIKLWDYGFDRRETLGGHSKNVRCMTIWKDHLCSGSMDCTIRIWEYNEMMDEHIRCKCIRVIKTKSPVYCMTIWDDYLVTGHHDGMIRIWSWCRDACVEEFLLYPSEEKDSIVRILSWNDKTLSVSSFKGLGLYTSAWNPFKNSIFRPSIKNQISAVFQISSRRDDGTPNYPECKLYLLPKEILVYILSFIE